jgi:hypothetical protein
MTTTGHSLLPTSPDVRLSWETEYFIGTFLPTLLASIFAIPWKILDHDTKTLEPFAHLARPGGGTATQTILLHYNGVSGLIHTLSTVFSADHAAVTLSTILKYSAALLSPLAAEGVHMGLQGACLLDFRESCTGTLRASATVVHVAQALLGVMGCAVVAYLLLLGGTWRNGAFGVASDPRCILGITCLSLNPFLRAVFGRESVQDPEGIFSGMCCRPTRIRCSRDS